jgi:hypothetical protein
MIPVRLVTSAILRFLFFAIQRPLFDQNGYIGCEEPLGPIVL